MSRQLAAVLVSLAAAFMLGGKSSASGKSVGNTYYVAHAGRDSNSGSSIADAWRTIQHAASVMTSGDTTLVEPGIYPERVSLTNSGAPAAPITFAADRHGKAPVAMLGFDLDASWIVVDGFAINFKVNGDPRDFGIHIEGTDDVIRNNYIQNLCAEGVYVEPSSAHISLLNNTFLHTEMAGAQLDGDGYLVQGNIVDGTYQYPSRCKKRVGADADGFRFFGSNGLFVNNIIKNIPLPGTVFNSNPHTDCFQTWGPANNVTFDSNWCEMPRPGNKNGGTNHIADIEQSSGPAHDLLFINNVFVGLYQGLLADGGTDDPPISLQFYNNTVATVTEQGLDLIQNASADIANNVFYNVGNGNDSYLDVESSSSNYTVETNVMWMANGTLPGTFGSDASYLNLNPGFVNVSALNFKLKAGAPIIDLGTALPLVTHDYTGESRPQGAGYDIGAFEYPN